ncbi:MAG: ABC transporter substrate-binding protein [Eubacteriales bacterium]|nr:ABC transporter substrate-binding protein [Eubacteriales bacterium]MDY4434177.1 ABC transporter substrate-binding protein [Candidatus Flemingibacterium sp.]
MIMKKFLSLALAALMTAGCLVGCGSAKKTPDGITVEGDTIKVGVFEPVTGENGGGGSQEVLGIRYANKQVPSVTIGDKEYKIELVEVDNQSDKTAAVTAASQLITSGVVAVLGSYGSGVSIAAGATFESAGVPAIGCSCTNPQVTLGNDFYFRVCFLDPFQGTVMANYAYATKGCQKAYVIYQNGDDYSTGLANYFMQAYKGEVVGQSTFNTNESDFNAYITAAKATNPDVVFVPSSIQTASLFIKQAREAGLDCAIMAGDTWENQTIIDNAGKDNATNVYLSTFFDENDSGAADFVKGYKEFLNSDNANLTLNGGNDVVAAVSALGYDAYMTLVEALRKVDPANVNSVAIRDALKTVSFTGVTGSISFDENGDTKKDTAFIKEMADGAFKFLGTQKTDGSFNAAN